MTICCKSLATRQAGANSAILFWPLQFTLFKRTSWQLKIAQIIWRGAGAAKKTRVDRSHLKICGNLSLLFASVYFVLGPDYNQYMDCQQAINLHIHERYEQEGIEFA